MWWVQLRFSKILIFFCMCFLSLKKLYMSLLPILFRLISSTFAERCIFIPLNPDIPESACIHCSWLLRAADQGTAEKLTAGRAWGQANCTNLGTRQGFNPQGSILLVKSDFFYGKVTHLIDQGKPVDVMILDVSKAFDTVSHGIFLDKMSSP